MHCAKTNSRKDSKDKDLHLTAVLGAWNKREDPLNDVTVTSFGCMLESRHVMLTRTLVVTSRDTTMGLWGRPWGLSTGAPGTF